MVFQDLTMLPYVMSMIWGYTLFLPDSLKFSFVLGKESIIHDIFGIISICVVIYRRFFTVRLSDLYLGYAPLSPDPLRYYLYWTKKILYTTYFCVIFYQYVL